VGRGSTNQGPHDRSRDVAEWIWLANSKDDWAEPVLGLESLLPLAKHRKGSLEEHATYLCDRTGASIGSLRALRSDAAIAAINEGSEKVDRPPLDSIKTDRAAAEHHAKAPPRPRKPKPLKQAM
jgi:hypothetical protein